MDAYSDFSFPWHLITSEAVSDIHKSITDDGVFIINVISSLEGNSGKIFRSVYWTLKKYFPQIYVFPVHNSENGQIIQNIIMVALKEENIYTDSNNYALYQQYHNYAWNKDIQHDVPLLTDDYAPLDYYYLLMN